MHFSHCPVGLLAESSETGKTHEQQLHLFFSKLMWSGQGKKKKRKFTNCPEQDMGFEGSWSQSQIQQALTGVCGDWKGQLCVSVLCCPPRLQLLEEEMIWGSAEWDRLNKPSLPSLGAGRLPPPLLLAW